MQTRLALISQGKLHLVGGGAKDVVVTSDFARDLKKRLQVSENRSALRSGSGAAFMRGMPTGPTLTVEDTFRAEFSCVAAGCAPGEVCYGIDAGEVRGLFIHDLAEKFEHRVHHGPRHRFSAISVRPGEEGPEWLVAASQDHGVSRIAHLRPKAGGGVNELTEGDSLDSYPAWVPGEGRRFVYQTCGIARHHTTNEWLGLGPASIQQVDLDSGEMEAVAEDGRYDFLCPAFSADGTLHYLQRPYEPVRRTSIGRIALDAVLFPFRMLRAIFAFLNVFSVFFSGKPLQTAGTPPRPGADPKAVFLHGRWINMEKRMRDAAVEEMTDVVPKNWQLVAQSADGSTRTVASSVMAFACGRDGTLYYSNGKGVFAVRTPGAAPEKVSGLKLVTALAEIDMPEAAAS